ncbi:MAG: glycoside hydrolase family 97 catalytic domain-containing protein [Acidimicrobiia bacterium]|nr:glycoside hydrolase family 97 catalytic domain-containing protein [Acidimicrobiia bacterium]
MQPLLQLESPNRRLRIEISSDASSSGLPGRLTYRVRFDDRPVLASSRLGLRRTDQDFSTVAVVSISPTATLAEEYELVYGKRHFQSSHATQSTIHGRAPGGAPLDVVLRAYDDGVAFRYRFPDHAPALHTVTEELTSFNFSAAGRAWVQEHDLPGLATPAYEAAYQNGIPIGTPTDLASWNLPALFETGDTWVLLAEADLSPAYFGGHLGNPDGREYRIVAPHPDEGMGIGSVEPHSSLPWETPWRVVVVGDTLAAIVETDLITHLSPPSRIEDTSWIHPGRVSWSWWSDRSSPQALDRVEPFVDLAAELGWEYTLLDAHWNVHPDEAIERFVRSALEKGVGVWLWYNSGGPNNEVMEQPRDRMYEPEIRRAEFAKLGAWGVSGVKVDFFHSDKQTGIQLYWDILAAAAPHEIMVNLHGCTIPRGWQRTWPHLMTMEGVRGAEQYGFDEHFPEVAVWHNTILPFTRNVVGSMDYTPVTFGDFLFPHLTTSGHELALAVVFESGLLHFADSVESYRGTPVYVQDLLRQIPAAWDDTRFIAGYPGDFAVLARRVNMTWYLAGINGTKEVRDLEVPLDFLTERSSALLVTDGEQGDWRSETGTYQPTDRLTLTMHPAGGFITRFDPVQGTEY